MALKFACVASVSTRVTARKLEGSKKKKNKLKIEGGEENSPFIFSSQIHTPRFHINWPSLVSTALSPIIY